MWRLDFRLRDSSARWFAGEVIEFSILRSAVRPLVARAEHNNEAAAAAARASRCSRRFGWPRSSSALKLLPSDYVFVASCSPRHSDSIAVHREAGSSDDTDRQAHTRTQRLSPPIFDA